MKALLLAASCAVVLALPATSIGASCAPPGNSGVNQYLETIPAANCNQTTGSSGRRGQGAARQPPLVAPERVLAAVVEEPGQGLEDRLRQRPPLDYTQRSTPFRHA